MTYQKASMTSMRQWQMVHTLKRTNGLDEPDEKKMKKNQLLNNIKINITPLAIKMRCFLKMDMDNDIASHTHILCVCCHKIVIKNECWMSVWLALLRKPKWVRMSCVLCFPHWPSPFNRGWMPIVNRLCRKNHLRLPFNEHHALQCVCHCCDNSQ